MVGRWVASVGHLIQFSFGVATAVIATQKGPNRKSENARAVLTCVFFLGKGNGVSEIGAGGLSERKKTLPYGLCTQCLFPPRGVKNVFSVFFWSRIRTEIRAFFWAVAEADWQLVTRVTELESWSLSLSLIISLGTPSGGRELLD